MSTMTNSGIKKKFNWAPYVLILPSLIYLLVFFAWPMVRGLTLAVWVAQFSGRPLPALPLVALAHLGWCLLRYPHTRLLSAGDRRLLLGLLGVAALAWAAWRI